MYKGYRTAIKNYLAKSSIFVYIFTITVFNILEIYTGVHIQYYYVNYKELCDDTSLMLK